MRENIYAENFNRKRSHFIVTSVHKIFFANSLTDAVLLWHKAYVENPNDVIQQIEKERV